MARQDVVRALVAAGDVPDVVGELTDGFAIPAEQIEVTDAEPAVYRDEAPELEVRTLVRTGRARMLVGGLLGAALGVAVALLVPWLRELSPYSVLLLAFGGAWAGAVTSAARGVQVNRTTGPLGEELHAVTPAEAPGLRLVTVRGVRDRGRIVDHLMDRPGVTLLDSDHPRVGSDEPGARPAAPRDDRAGPPAP